MPLSLLDSNLLIALLNKALAEIETGRLSASDLVHESFELALDGKRSIAQIELRAEPYPIITLRIKQPKEGSDATAG